MFECDRCCHSKDQCPPPLHSASVGMSCKTTLCHNLAFLRCRSRPAKTESLPDKAASRRTLQPQPDQVRCAFPFCLPQHASNIYMSIYVCAEGRIVLSFSGALCGLIPLCCRNGQHPIDNLTACLLGSCDQKLVDIPKTAGDLQQWPRVGMHGGGGRRQPLAAPASPGSISSLGGDSDAWPHSPHSPCPSFGARSVSADYFACILPVMFCSHHLACSPPHTHTHTKHGERTLPCCRSKGWCAACTGDSMIGW